MFKVMTCRECVVKYRALNAFTLQVCVTTQYQRSGMSPRTVTTTTMIKNYNCTEGYEEGKTV